MEPIERFIDATGFGRRLRVQVDGYGAIQAIIDDELPADEWRAYEERRNQAAARSKELFMRLLTDSQRATFASGSWIDVTAKSGRIYRIHCGAGHSGNVFWVDPDSKEVKGSFCVYPGCFDLPEYDFYLGQLLLIATDEEKFLDVGVFHGPIHPTRGRDHIRHW